MSPGDIQRPTRGNFALAGVAAAAAAIGQAFNAETCGGRLRLLTQSLSLWTSASDCDSPEDIGPNDFCLPCDIWMIGLGNLGQAYAWSLAALPYESPGACRIILQDDDKVAEENWGTSLIVERGNYGALKTAAVERWFSSCGFEILRVDRRVDQHLKRTVEEPAIALVGLDSMAARRLVGAVGFDFVVDSGLGATALSYQKFRINVFDATSDVATHFSDVEAGSADREILELPAYAELRRADSCGAALLAGKSVAVPFVGAFVGAVAVAQLIRVASGLPSCASLTGDSTDLRSIRFSVGRTPRAGAIRTQGARIR